MQRNRKQTEPLSCDAADAALWHSLRAALADPSWGRVALAATGVTKLDKAVWGPRSTSDLDRANISRSHLLDVVDNLCYGGSQEAARSDVATAYRDVGTDALVGVYEALLGLVPVVDVSARTFSAWVPADRFALSPIPVAHVMQVPARSPLRYPGGKLWLVPHVRHWLGAAGAETLIEPFAGGAIVSLTAVAEDLVQRAIMVEIDEDVAALWRAALYHGPALAARVAAFVPTVSNVRGVEDTEPGNIVDRAFRTLVLNRTRYAGILHRTAGSIKFGDGRGIASRWYGQTLLNRLSAIEQHADRLSFAQGNGLEMLDEMIAFWGEASTAVFADPPYTTGGGKRAGRGLYNHHEVDHNRLFAQLANSGVAFLMTYDISPEVVDLVDRYGFHAVKVEPRTAKHRTVPEILVTRTPVFD